uniref:Pentacotripeptide-repeat region of PRORP domain-containing protein n=1 Tax=Globisporangium ultimum (strain ATCC 200006 / CBS 805.95 / DAOM BR144) TaxID=431595 RepID=K3WG26_GLOUD
MQILSAVRARNGIPGGAEAGNALASATQEPVIWTPTYELLLFELTKRGDLKQTLAVLEEMVAFDRVSRRGFHTALVACSKRRRLKSAVTVLELMRESGMTPGPFAYANVINCCSKGQGNVRVAEKFWHEMLHDGVEPSIEVVNCMLRVYNRLPGRSLDALAFVYDALDKYDLTLDDISIAQLVLRLLQDGNLDVAVELLEDTQIETSVEIDVLNAVLDASRQLESWDNVARIEATIRSQQQQGELENPVTQRLLELSRAKDASSSPGIAWTLSVPHPPISARTKRKEAEKLETQRPVHLQKMLREIIAALERVMDEDCEHDGDIDEILGQVTNMKQWERIFTVASFKDIERFFALCQQLDQASAARDGESDCKAFLDVTMYNLYLYALGKQEHGDKNALLTRALDVLDEMSAKKQVDATSFNNVLALCSRMGELENAEIVLQKMKTTASTQLEDCQPTVFSYNAVLNCCAMQKADIARAERCLEELQTQGIAPDLVTLNTMLKMYSSASIKSSMRQRETTMTSSSSGYPFSMRALRLFQKCTRKHRIEPDAATYFSLFRTFVQAADKFASVHEYGGNSGEEGSDYEEGDGDDDDVYNKLAAFIQRTCRHAPTEQLDVGVFNAAIDYFQRLGDVKTCFELFNTMTTSRGLEPNDLTLSLLFAACSRSEQVDVGLKFLHYLMDDHDYHPSLNVLNGAIRLCASSDAPQHALELFQGIQSSGVIQPDEATYVHVIHAFARQGDIVEARNFADAMHVQLGLSSLDAYNRVLQACAVAHAPRQALSVLQHMKESGEALTPNAVSYNMVLKAFAKGRTAARHSEGGHSHEGSDHEHVEDAEDGDDSEDDEEHEEEEEEPFSSDEIHHLMADLLEEMERRGLPLSAITYTRAIAACAVRGDTRGVLRLFDAIMQRSENCEATMKLLSDSSMNNYLKACVRIQDRERVTELLQLCKQWHERTKKPVSRPVVLHLLQALDALGEWRSAVAVLRDLEATLGVRANVTFVNSVLETCNRAEQFQVTAQIFDTMQNAAAYRVFPNAKSYVEAIFAAEQREEWVHATNLFMEMQHKCPKDEIAAVGLQKIALGRYSEGRRTL